MVKRTALVTATSIAAVLLTGTAAVGANIGILSSADDSPIGDLSATTELATPTPIDVVIDLPETFATPEPSPTSAPRRSATSPGDSSADRTEAFQVDQAGTAVIAVVGRTLVVESVDAASGWTYVPDDDVADDSVDVRFTSGSDVLVLEVDLLDDGTLRAEITRPAAASTSGVAPPTGAPAPSAVPTTAARHDDDRDEVDDHSDDDDRDEVDDHSDDDDRDEVEDHSDDDDRDEVEDHSDDDEHEGRDDDD